ncbi:hypothetical protein CAPTEDRAFT_187927 [Capitella teleta]|uniref:Apple domain-containing protein n=1 Tax=Capitella teleta TaxID=283909 RepID=R7UCW6_CAPTE|nr:hypothetical protein CAPTEDRAFT_187927 [Capitella teleta]|eukprot:ELU01102.1 hypothetical protein CAPTEDRAFT_187927 [Capitella teleta]
MVLFAIACWLSLVINCGAIRQQTAQLFSPFQISTPVFSEFLLPSMIKCIVLCTQTDNCAAVDVIQESSSVLCKLRDKIQASTPVLLVTDPPSQQFIIGTWEFIKHINTCIIGFNDIILYGISVDECKATCVSERAFFCRTAEWLPANPTRSSRCSLSKDWKDSVSDGAWENPCSVAQEHIVYQRMPVK